MYARRNPYGGWVFVMNVTLTIVAAAVVALIGTAVQAYCQMPLLECVVGGGAAAPLSAPLPTPVLQVPGAGTNQRASGGTTITVQQVPQVGQPETAVQEQGVIVDLIPPTVDWSYPPTPIPAAPSLYDGFSEQQKEEFHAPVATPLPTSTTDVQVWMANATAMSNQVSENEVKVCGGGRSGSCWVVTVTPMGTGR